MALTNFTLSNARRFYSSMGNPLGWKGLIDTLSLRLFRATVKQTTQINDTDEESWLTGGTLVGSGQWRLE